MAILNACRLQASFHTIDIYSAYVSISFKPKNTRCGQPKAVENFLLVSGKNHFVFKHIREESLICNRIFTPVIQMRSK